MTAGDVSEWPRQPGYTEITTYESDCQISGKQRLPAPGHATGRVQGPACPVVLRGSPPRESNRRPHPYHSCCRAPLAEPPQVRGPWVSVVDRGEPWRRARNGTEMAR